MKKFIIILIAIITIVALTFLGWYLFVRDPSVPVGEAVSGVLPFGSGDNIPSQTLPDSAVLPNTDESLIIDEFASPQVNLFRISSTPVAGEVILLNGTSTTVRYVDRATGHIYDVNLSTGEKVKISNQTMPKIYEAYFRQDGGAVLIRSLKDDSDIVENISLTLTQPKETGEPYGISSTLFRGDISSVAVGSGDNLFFALRDSQSIISSTFSSTKTKTLLTSPFTSWNLKSNGDNLIVNTKASAGISGYSYSINNGGLTKILGPLNGLITTPNDSNKSVLFSYADGGKIKLFVKNLTSNSFYEISPTSLAEKCVWGKKNINLVFCGAPTEEIGPNEPDSWYLGITSFSDRIWRFDTKTETAQVLVEPKSLLEVDIDVYEPQISPNDAYLVFINRKDLSLWALRLEQF